MIFVFTCETKDLRYLQWPPLVLANAPQGSIRKSFTVIVSLSSHTYFSFFLVVGLEFHLNSLYSTYVKSFISELPCVIIRVYPSARVYIPVVSQVLLR